MSFNATRLTCFALLSALESDCREEIIALDEQSGIRWPEVAKKVAQERMARERLTQTEATESLVHFLDFADAFQVLLAHKADLPGPLLSSLNAVKARLEEVIAIRNRVAHTRPMEIGDLATLNDISSTVLRESADGWIATRATRERLEKEPAFVLGLTVELPSDPTMEPQHNLPIPDFDETGFLGRNKELRRVKKALLGPYPVVSILGDGGIGKTAIALKVAYDLLDTADSPFEAIVWVSAKATTLTSGEIASINGAIKTSLGLFEAAAVELAGENRDVASDPIEDILEYLAAFKVLLILDNLETVTDKRLRDFLLDLPLGSKVLLTSRIGLGIENPVKLESLSEEESKQFLRTLAGLRNVKPLKELDDEAVTRLVRKLRGHPLFIKWLVAGVQAGRRPAELINDNSLLLDFCMSNVWDKLSRPARSMLQTMQIAKGQKSLGELAFLTNEPADLVQEAILELMTTNFVVMKYSANAELDGAFETGDFASQYLARHQAPTPQFRSGVIRLNRELEVLGRDFVTESRSDPYNEFTIDVRDRANVPTARILHSAIRHLKQGNYDLALVDCGNAATLAPTYAEVWRVQGLVNLYQNDIIAAEQDFERAMEYSDSSAVMTYHFARFLSDSAGDSHSAIELLNKGLRANPDDPMLLYLLGVINYSEEKYSEAIGASSILARLTQIAVPSSQIAELALGAAVFGIESHLWGGNFGAAVELLEDVSRVLDAVGSSELDERSADSIIRLLDSAKRLQDEAESEEYLSRKAIEYGNSLEQRVRKIDPGLLSRTTGLVVKVDAEKRFGFLRDSQGDTFFHRNDFINREEWLITQTDRIAAYDPLPTAKGRKAARIRIL